MQHKIYNYKFCAAWLLIQHNVNSSLYHCTQEQTTHIEKRSIPVNHDEYETVAQSVCTSMAIDRRLNGWTYAVQRVCSSSTETCQEICSSKFLHVQDSQTVHSTWSCIGALHVYKNRPSSSPGTKQAPSIGLKVFWWSNYHTHRSCGPNFCCCHAHWNSQMQGMVNNYEGPLRLVVIYGHQYLSAFIFSLASSWCVIGILYNWLPPHCDKYMHMYYMYVHKFFSMLLSAYHYKLKLERV